MMNKPVAIFIFPCFLVTTKSCKDLIFYCPFQKIIKRGFTLLSFNGSEFEDRGIQSH